MFDKKWPLDQLDHHLKRGSHINVSARFPKISLSNHYQGGHVGKWTSPILFV